MIIAKKNIGIRDFCLLFLLFMQAVFFSCDSLTEEQIDTLVEQPMLFSFQLPDDNVVTRAKTAFAEGDLIYITAKITVEDSDITQRSTILRYVGGTWEVSDEGTLLIWPLNAVSADFTAYYLPKYGEEQVPGVPALNAPVEISLGDLRNATDDPLIAVRKDVKVNGATILQFVHTTSKLQVTGLKNVKDSSTPQVTKKVTLYNQNDAFVFNNLFILSYSEEEGYVHSFASDESREITQTVVTDGQVVFFLNVDAATWEACGADFKLSQKDASDNLVVEQATNLSEVSLYTMKAGRHYRIYFLSGDVSSNLIEEEKWYAESEVKTFSDAEDIRTYFSGLTDSGLTEDLDFNNIPLSGSGIDLFNLRVDTKGIALSKNFNGNHHTIYNVCIDNGFFESIPDGCTVRDLCLENVTVQAISSDYAGLLTPLNEGTIDNVRIRGVNILGAQNASYVGGLVGLNKGSIKNVSVSGTLTIDCLAPDGAVFVGGLVGSNGTEKGTAYTISNSKIIAGMTIKVVGEVTANDAHVGGFAGFNVAGNTITGCATSAVLNAAGLKAQNCYTGGFIGLNRGNLLSCEASGNVWGGTASNRVALGGFAGYMTSSGESAASFVATLNGGSSSGNVYETDNQEYDSYVGGFCGFSEIDVLNASSVGTVRLASSANPNRSAGAFIGILSSDKTSINSFSVTPDHNFTGMTQSLATNCHLRGMMLDDQSIETETRATIGILNNARKTEYWEWASSGIYDGVPYLIKR